MALNLTYQGTSWDNAQDFVPDNSNRGPALEAANIAFFVLASIALGLRLYTRIFVVKFFGSDDSAACVAWVFAAGTVGTMIAGVRHGVGRHLDLRTEDAVVSVLKDCYAIVILSTACLVFLKLSILGLYLRITASKSCRYTIYGVMLLVMLHGTSALLGAILQCIPVSAYWNILEFQTKCLDFLSFDIFNSIFSALTEMTIWVLPIPVIREQLYILVSFGLLTIVASWAKLGVLILWIHSADITFNFDLIVFLCVLEVCSGLITSSAPAIFPLLSRSSRFSDQSQSQNTYPMMNLSHTKSFTISTLTSSAKDFTTRDISELKNYEIHIRPRGSMGDASRRNFVGIEVTENCGGYRYSKSVTDEGGQY